MKPVRLILDAFGPYAGRVEIPFDKLTCGGGLYLITGATGAGKTTVFDAISFALFGSASGVNRENETLRSDFAAPQEKTCVSLSFLHRNEIYTVERVPRYKRPKKSGVGFTEQLPDAVLTLPDESTVSGNAVVTKYIEELLGLDYRRFKQVAMIAQGEFLNLLFADSKARAAIFREIFSTDIFIKIQDELKKQSLSLKGELEAAAKDILSDYENIVVRDSESELARAAEEADVYNADDVLNLLKKQNEEDDARLKEAQAELEKIQESILANAREKEAAIQAGKLEEEIRLCESEIEKLKMRSAENEQDEKRLKKGKQALYVKPFADAAHSVKAQLAELGAKQTALEKAHIALEQTNAQNAAAFKTELEREDERVKLAEAVKQLADALSIYENVEQAGQKLFALKKECEKITADTSKLSADCSALEARKNAVGKDLSTLEKARNDLQIKSNALEQLRNTTALMKEAQAYISSLERERVQAETAAEEYCEKERVYTELKQTFDCAEKMFFRAQAGLLAMKLAEDEPCPVCGSTKHPQKACLPGAAPNEAQLKEQKNALEAARESVNNAASKAADAKARSEQAEQGVRDAVKRANSNLLTAEKVPELKQQLAGALKGANETARLLTLEKEDLEEKCKLEKKLKNDLLETEQELTEKTARLTEKKNAFLEKSNQKERADAEYITMRAALPHEYSSKQALQQAMESKKQKAEMLNAALERARESLEKSKNELARSQALKENYLTEKERLQLQQVKADEAFEAALNEYAFEDAQAYEAAFLEKSLLDKLETGVRNFNSAYESALNNRVKLQAMLKNCGKYDTEKILLLEKNLQERRTASENAKTAAALRYTQNQKKEESLFKHCELRKKLEERFQSLQILSDTANGQLKGKPKIAFEQYVQSFYFNSILEKANLRLLSMTDGRFRLLKKEEVSDARTKAGLELDVMDYYTGKTRTVKSLSGGEAFKAALSLALGMSDVVQSYAGGIEVDAMFIDEGFGSLDHESLLQAIGTLERLAVNNRMIGIISHVSELSEVIGSKIIVQKGLHGSAVSVVRDS